MSRKYKFYNTSGAYFVSFATVYWIDIFTREVYFKVLCDSIDYCREHKGMEVFAYCFMQSHVHLIFRDDQENQSALTRDFKKFTAKKMIASIQENPQESRKEWLLWMMEQAAKKKGNIAQYQFWQHHNKPIELWSNKVIHEKINYIHNNPVEAGLVFRPEDYIYSSAIDYTDEKGLLENIVVFQNLG